MSVQLPLSLDGLYDSQARRAGCPKQPSTRAGCISGRESRMAGEEECPHVECRYHLLGELTRRPEAEAVKAMASRLSGEWCATCALDVADTHDSGLPDEDIAKILGIDARRVTQISAETTARLRRWIDEEEKEEG